MIIKQSKNRLSTKNIGNSAKLKTLKNFNEYKKNLVESKICKGPNFLNSATRLAYTRLRQIF